MEISMNSARNWAIADRRYRFEVRWETGSYVRTNKVFETDVNLTQLLAAAGGEGKVSVNSIRVVELEANGEVTDGNVRYQFDPAPDFDPGAKASGTRLIYAKGVREAESGVEYHVYSDTEGSVFLPAVFEPLITVTDPVVDEEQLCFKISTSNATYF